MCLVANNAAFATSRFREDGDTQWSNSGIDDSRTERSRRDRRAGIGHVRLLDCLPPPPALEPFTRLLLIRLV